MPKKRKVVATPKCRNHYYLNVGPKQWRCCICHDFHDLIEEK